jgi:hypothetical protein
LLRVLSQFRLRFRDGGRVIGGGGGTDRCRTGERQQAGPDADVHFHVEKPSGTLAGNIVIC